MKPIDADKLMKDLYHRAFETDGDTMWQSGCWVRYRAIEQTVKEQPTIEPERPTGRWIETEGLDEEIRCLMCTNYMRSDRGCDGACQYDKHMHKKIMSAIKRRMMEVEHDG